VGFTGRCVALGRACQARQTSFISIANCSLTFPYTLQIAGHFSAIFSISQVLTQKFIGTQKAETSARKRRKN
jgi:hypothetical protein